MLKSKDVNRSSPVNRTCPDYRPRRKKQTKKLEARRPLKTETFCYYKKEIGRLRKSGSGGEDTPKIKKENGGGKFRRAEIKKNRIV